MYTYRVIYINSQFLSSSILCSIYFFLYLQNEAKHKRICENIYYNVNLFFLSVCLTQESVTVTFIAHCRPINWNAEVQRRKFVVACWLMLQCSNYYWFLKSITWIIHKLMPRINNRKFDESLLFTSKKIRENVIFINKEKYLIGYYVYLGSCRFKILIHIQDNNSFGVWRIACYNIKINNKYITLKRLTD